MNTSGYKWGVYNDEGRICRACGEFKAWDKFHSHPKAPHGKNTVCAKCRKPLSKSSWERKDLRKKILDRAKTRAVERGIEFNIDIDDIVIPQLCPIFKRPLEVPSIDRIDSSRGYVKGNIQIVESRANTLKSNAKIWELRMIIDHLTGDNNGRT